MHKRKKALKYEVKPDLSGMFIRDNTYLDSSLEVLRELSIGYREIQAALKKNSEEHKINAEEHRINAEEHKKNSEEHEKIFNQLNEHSGALKELQTDVKEIRADIVEIRTEMQAMREDMIDMRKSLKETNRAVAALGNIIGYSLEDLTKIILPKWLKSEENIIVHNITRKFTKLPNGVEIETNFICKGTKNGRPIVVIGEAKAAAHRHGIHLIESITLVKLTPSGLIMSSPDYNPCYP